MAEHALGPRVFAVAVHVALVFRHEARELEHHSITADGRRPVGAQRPLVLAVSVRDASRAHALAERLTADTDRAVVAVLVLGAAVHAAAAEFTIRQALSEGVLVAIDVRVAQRVVVVGDVGTLGGGRMLEHRAGLDGGAMSKFTAALVARGEAVDIDHFARAFDLDAARALAGNESQGHQQERPQEGERFSRL